MAHENGKAAPTVTLAKIERQDRFLAALGETGILKTAAHAAGISVQTHFLWLREDPEYPAKYALAREVVGAMLEAEAVRRGHDGYNGVGGVKEYSDRLLLALLRAYKPREYGNALELRHTGADGGPIQVNVQALILKAQANPEAVRLLARLAEILELPGAPLTAQVLDLIDEPEDDKPHLNGHANGILPPDTTA